VQQEQYEGCMIHEMGHAMGERHQFASSWDAMNYFPQYWQLRTHETAVAATANCKGVPRDLNNPQDTCLGPRYLDPLTPDEMGTDPSMEAHPSIAFFGQTSTMEYQNEAFSEGSGLGTWDYHMTKAIYGNVLETYDDKVMPADEQYKHGAAHFTHLSESNYVYGHATRDNEEEAPFSDWFDIRLHTVHYTKLARMINVFDPARDCRPATEDEKRLGKWRVIHGKVCSPYPRDNAAWQDFVSDHYDPIDFEDTVLAWHTRNDAPNGYTNKGNVRWHYFTGESYDPAWIHTNMFDGGADEYEIAVNAIQHFDASYPFTYFRQQNADGTTRGIPGYAAGVLFDYLRSYHWSTANTALTYMSYYGTGPAYQYLATDDDELRPAAMGNAEIFNVLTRYVLLPQPGDFKVRAGEESVVYDSLAKPVNDANFTVRIIDGRYIDEAYNASPSGGGSWDFQRYWTRAGFYIEKSFSFLGLCDSRPTLSTMSRDNYLDGRGVKLNYRSDMPEAFDRLLGGILAEDWPAIAMWIPNGASGVVTPQLLNIERVDQAPSRPDNAKLLYPNLGYTQQLYSAFYSALYARENTDMTLIHKMRIWVDGADANISDAAFPKAEDQLRFYDPGSGFTYIARRFGEESIDGHPTELGIASRVLQRANQLVTFAYEVNKDTGGKPILDVYGRPTVVIDTTTNEPKVVDSTKRGQLTRYVGLIDSIRQLGMWLGQGPYN
jgi:hypothetical protein